MTAVFRHHRGESPLLISVPHDGRDIPDDLRERMTAAGRAIPDTDWHVAKLYDFARELGAGLVVANYSRYVVDLNRPADDQALYPGQVATGLCPLETFSGESIYCAGGVDESEKGQRIERFWRPYHECLQNSLRAIRSEHGCALLWDAHSIPSIVPRLFDGELPVLNLGSNDGRSAAPAIERAVAAVAAASPYPDVCNGRFKGGFITRHYGDPQNGVHALQLEIAQRAYMSEETRDYDTAKAATLRDTLRQMLSTYLAAARN